ncbi:41691_t:CDS:2, partial [Gigaspora margarita]
EAIEILNFNLSSVNMNIEKAEYEFVSLLDNKLFIVIGTYSVSTKLNMLIYQENPELEVLLTNNPYKASVFDKNKT